MAATYLYFIKKLQYPSLYYTVVRIVYTSTYILFLSLVQNLYFTRLLILRFYRTIKKQAIPQETEIYINVFYTSFDLKTETFIQPVFLGLINLIIDIQIIVSLLRYMGEPCHEGYEGNVKCKYMWLCISIKRDW